MAIPEELQGSHDSLAPPSVAADACAVDAQQTVRLEGWTACRAPAALRLLSKSVAVRLTAVTM